MTSEFGSLLDKGDYVQFILEDILQMNSKQLTYLSWSFQQKAELAKLKLHWACLVAPCSLILNHLRLNLVIK